MAELKGKNVVVVMGGQFGSEGKGEMVAYMASEAYKSGKHVVVIRTGGPNAGHTMTLNGETYKMRQVPCGWHIPTATLVIAAGSLIDPDVLADELDMISAYYENTTPFGPPHVMVDEAALVIEPKHKEEEAAKGMRARIGSTAEGIGAARADHIMRTATLFREWLFTPKLEGQEVRNRLKERVYADSSTKRAMEVRNTQTYLSQLLPGFRVPERNAHVIVESTQGFGLSLTASEDVPIYIVERHHTGTDTQRRRHILARSAQRCGGGADVSNTRSRKLRTYAC